MSDNATQPDTGVSGDPDELLAPATMRMPFGKYQGRFLIDLPEPYVVWLAGQGFPDGTLGRMLQAVYEIKVNGLEYLFTPLRNWGRVNPPLKETAQVNSIRRQKK
jgi:uncharacterized protein